MSSLGNKLTQKLDSTFLRHSRHHYYRRFGSSERFADTSCEVRQTLGLFKSCYTIWQLAIGFGIGDFRGQFLETSWMSKDVYQKLNRGSGNWVCTGNPILSGFTYQPEISWGRLLLPHQRRLGRGQTYNAILASDSICSIVIEVPSALFPSRYIRGNVRPATESNWSDTASLLASCRLSNQK